MSDRKTAFLFDLDGTLVDSVYQHVLAWHEALEQVGIELSVWRIHRKIGMSGGLFANALLRETGLEITTEPRGGAAAAPCGILCAAFQGNPAAPRGNGAPGRALRSWRAVGDRDQRAPGLGAADLGRLAHRSGARANRHPRSGPAREARSRPVSRGGRTARRRCHESRDRRRQHLGPARRPPCSCARRRRAVRRLRAGGASSAPAPIASTTTRATS